jgi:putative hydrolase of the HAD superfamily
VFRRWIDEFANLYRLPPDARATMRALDDGGRMPRDRFFASVRERFGLTPSAEEMWFGYRRRMPQLATCARDVLDRLAFLRRDGWRIGIVTNGQPDNQLGKIQRTGLATYVDGWAISGEFGVRKPDPELFEIAAARCGGSLDHGVMTGDNPDYDIVGGQDAGMRTIWVRRGQEWPDDLDAPDAVADSVIGAIDLIARNGRR